MPAATLSSKGQLVVPKPVRDHLGIKAGDQLDFIIKDDGEVVVRPATIDFRELRGCLSDPARKPVSLAEMERAIRRRSGSA